MRIGTHGGHRREGLLCGSRTSWHTSLQWVLTIWRECERSARKERKTDQEDRRPSFAEFVLSSNEWSDKAGRNGVEHV